MTTNKQNQGGRASSERTSQANRQNQKESASKGEGRGWHGDPKGHAKAGSQSHKNS